MAYITEADITARFGTFVIPAPWSTTANLDALIAEVSEVAEAITGQRFSSVSRTVYITGDGASKTLSVLKWTTWPMTSITSIFRRQAVTESYDVEVESEFYEIAPSRHGITLDHPWKKSGLKNYKIIAQFGRFQVPEVVKSALVLLAQERMAPGAVNAFDGNFTSEAFPDGYKYTRGGTVAPSKANAGMTTGFPLIDDWLNAYRVTSPFSIGVV